MKAVQWYLADLLLGETPWLDLNTACSLPEPWVSVPKQTLENVTSDYYVIALNHTAYAGTYNHQAFGNITVYLNTTRHYLNVKQGRLGHALLKQTDTLHQCQIWSEHRNSGKCLLFMYFIHPHTYIHIYTYIQHTCIYTFSTQTYIHPAHRQKYTQHTYIRFIFQPYTMRFSSEETGLK